MRAAVLRNAMSLASSATGPGAGVPAKSAVAPNTPDALPNVKVVLLPETFVPNERVQVNAPASSPVYVPVHGNELGSVHTGASIGPSIGPSITAASGDLPLEPPHATHHSATRPARFPMAPSRG